VAAGQSQTGGGGSGGVFGLQINETSVAATVRNSIFYQNTGVSPLVPIGVNCRGNNCLFTNCTSHTNNLPTTTTLTGIGFNMFSLSTTQGLNNSFVRCNAFNNTTGFNIAIAGGAVNTQNQCIKNASCNNTTNYNGFPTGSVITSATIAGLNGITTPWSNIGIN